MKAKSTITAPVLVVLVMALSIVLGYIDSSVLGEGDEIFLSVALLQLVVIFLPTLLYCRIRGIGVSELRLKLPGVQSIFFIISSVFVMIFGCMLISYLLYFLGVPVSQSVSYSDYIPEGFSSHSVFIALAFAVVPAITEELLCRSVLLREYESSGMVTAVVMSSLLFSILHFNVASLPTYIFSGLILGFVAYVTRSVVASMVLHLINNIYILFFQEYTAAVIKMPQNVVFTMFFTIALFLLALFFTVSQAEHIIYRSGVLNLDSEADFLPKNRKSGFLDAVLSPTFLVCLAVYLVLIFVIA